MGNRVEKNMSVGVTANVAQFNKAMSDMRRHIGYAQKATTEASTYMAAFEKVLEDTEITAKQKAIVMARLTAQIDKQTAAVRAATQANNAWAAGLQKVHMTALAMERGNPWLTGLGTMDRQNASRAKSDAEKAAKDAAAAASQAERDILAREGGEYMAQFGGSRAQMRTQMMEADAMYRKGAISATEYVGAVRAIRQQHSMLGQSFAMVKDSILTMIGPLVIAVKSYEFIVDSLQKFLAYERNLARMSTFVGGMGGAQALMGDIRNFTGMAPVSFDSAQRSVSTMLQFGMSVNDVVPALKQLAEITGGDSMRLEQLTLAFAQASAAGRLMGQELLQMVNAGFNPLKVISDETGVSMGDLKRQMEDGAVSFEMVAEAAKKATSEGGQYNGLLREMADTSAGSINKLTNAIEELKIGLGSLGAGAFKDEIDMLMMIRFALFGDKRTLGTPMRVAGNIVGATLGDRRALQDLLMPTNFSKLALEQYNTTMAQDGLSTFDQQQALIDYVQGAGKLGNMNPALKAAYDNAVRFVEEERKRDQEETSTISKFSGAIQGQRKDFLKNVYGDRSSIVQLLLDTAVGGTGKMDALIEQKAPYEQILALASETARQEAKRLELMMKTNDEFKTQEGNHKKASKAAQDEMEAVLDNIDDQRAAHKKMRDAFESDARSVGQKYNPSDRLARLMAMQQMGLISDADFNRERASLLSDSNAAARSVSAPSAVQAGSAEVVSILANLQVQAVSEQQRLADRAAKFQKITADATAGMFKILDEIRDDLVTGNAP